MQAGGLLRENRPCWFLRMQFTGDVGLVLSPADWLVGCSLFLRTRSRTVAKLFSVLIGVRPFDVRRFDWRRCLYGIHEDPNKQPHKTRY